MKREGRNRRILGKACEQELDGLHDGGWVHCFVYEWMTVERKRDREHGRSCKRIK
jgi:hypothetical protein